MRGFDPVGDFLPFDDLAGNRCAVCLSAVSGLTRKVPTYFCPSCHRLWWMAFEAREPWIWMLYQAKHSRRKRRARRLRAGLLPPLGLDALMDTARI